MSQQPQNHRGPRLRHQLPTLDESMESLSRMVGVESPDTFLDAFNRWAPNHQEEFTVLTEFYTGHGGITDADSAWEDMYNITRSYINNREG